MEKKPTLVGYYRLLLGISQKRFYRKGTGMGPFKSMETRGLFNPKKRPDLERFCTVMAENLAELVRQNLAEDHRPRRFRVAAPNAGRPTLRQQQ